MLFSPSVYQARRQLVASRLGSNAAALFASAPESTRSNDVDFVYRQDNDLLYLTGFPEPGAACLLLPGRPQGEFVLFVRPRDPERETWTGRRAGVEGAVTTFGADEALPNDELDSRVKELTSGRSEFFYSLGRDTSLNDKVLSWVRRGLEQRPRLGHGLATLADPTQIVHEMRLIKSPGEIEAMRRAAAITAAAHSAAMGHTRPGLWEYEIEALLDYEFRRRGASGAAYPSIVASGGNATILHYTSNDQLLADGDLLLIDAGAEFDGYCADVTRTFPVGGQFSGPQREIYELVLEAQLAAIEAVRPGVPFDEPHRRVVEILVRGLVALGLLEGTPEDLIAQEAYRPFYMHRTSHWLGMDVHDVGQYRRDDAPRVLEAGMVLTIEPGLYISGESQECEGRYRNIGVRIEDDVLVTEDGAEVLTAAIPKSTAEMEATRALVR